LPGPSAPGQSLNPVVNIAAQPPGSQLLLGPSGGPVNAVDTLCLSLAGPQPVTTQSGPTVGLVSQPTGLATQPLCTQPPATTGLGLPEAQLSVRLGPEASSSQPPVNVGKISTCAYTKATSSVGLSHSPEATSQSVPKTVSFVSIPDSVAPAAAPIVSAVPTVPQGVWQVKLKERL